MNYIKLSENETSAILIVKILILSKIITYVKKHGYGIIVRNFVICEFV